VLVLFTVGLAERRVLARLFGRRVGEPLVAQLGIRGRMVRITVVRITVVRITVVRITVVRIAMVHVPVHHLAVFANAVRDESEVRRRTHQPEHVQRRPQRLGQAAERRLGRARAHGQRRIETAPTRGVNARPRQTWADRLSASSA